MSETDIHLPLNGRNLRFRWLRRTHDISFDAEFLTVTETRFYRQRTTARTALWRLMAEFVVDMQRDYRSDYYGRRFRYSLAAAAVIYFSDIPRFVPYLAPALAAYALIMFYRGWPYQWPRQQTRVLTTYSEQIVSIPHLKALEGQRERFEEQLRTAIKAAKAAEDQ